MIAKDLIHDLLPYGSLIVALLVATISGYFALRGKKLDAGQWITDTLQNDAEVNRLELKSVKEQFEKYKDKTGGEIQVLQEAVASLIIKEKELLAYISLLEKEVNILRELLVLQGGATPDVKITPDVINIPDNLTHDQILAIIDNIKKGKF